MDDDVVVYDGARHTREIGRVDFLRQQIAKRGDRASFCLADVASVNSDYISGFVVTYGHDSEACLARFKSQHDDYSDIRLKAFTDRLAEAFTERMHERVRKEFWGYAADESLSNGNLVAETYRGIRAAPGCPARQDHSEKTKLFRLLYAYRQTRVSPAENFAIFPTVAVSGCCLSHPQARYLVGVGRK